MKKGTINLAELRDDPSHPDWALLLEIHRQHELWERTDAGELEDQADELEKQAGELGRQARKLRDYLEGRYARSEPEENDPPLHI